MCSQVVGLCTIVFCVGERLLRAFQRLKIFSKRRCRGGAIVSMACKDSLLLLVHLLTDGTKTHSVFLTDFHSMSFCIVQHFFVCRQCAVNTSRVPGMCILEKYPKNCHEGKNLTTLSVLSQNVQLHIDALAIPQAHNYMCTQLHNTTRRTVQALKTSPDV